MSTREEKETSIFSIIENRTCPNHCGKLTFLKKPIKIAHLLPEEFIESDEDRYGQISAICLKCGFTLTETRSEKDFREENK